MLSEPSSGIKLTAYSCISWLFHRIAKSSRWCTIYSYCISPWLINTLQDLDSSVSYNWNAMGLQHMCCVCFGVGCNAVVYPCHL